LVPLRNSRKFPKISSSPAGVFKRDTKVKSRMRLLELPRLRCDLKRGFHWFFFDFRITSILFTFYCKNKTKPTKLTRDVYKFRTKFFLWFKTEFISPKRCQISPISLKKIFHKITPKFCEIQAKANFCVIWACISSSSSFDIGREGSESEDYR